MKLEIQGALDGSTVASHLARLTKELPTSGVMELSLAEVAEVDSTGVALLISLHKVAKIRGFKLVLDSVPLPLKRLIAVARLSEYLLNETSAK